MSPDDRTSETIHLEHPEQARALLGRQDRHLRLLRDAFGIRVVMRGSALTLEGETRSVRRAVEVVQELLGSIRKSGEISVTEVEHAIGVQRGGETGSELQIDVFTPGRAVKPRTSGQSVYVRSMAENDLVFCEGPAGSGKTYLAVAMAVAALKRDAVRKIVLARPAVEAGEKLGFLPGDLQAEVDPYLRPLYDALHDMMAFDQLRRYMENDLVEVVPLAFMRGRTLDHAFIILDEGQNCTRRQMKMFLTRLGPFSKGIVTGDLSQTDLPDHEPSGMAEAIRLLRKIQGIGFVQLTQSDIIRHRLVQDIVDAYEARDREAAARSAAPRQNG